MKLEIVKIKLQSFYICNSYIVLILLICLLLIVCYFVFPILVLPFLYNRR